jgi:2-amino-4-hydroxy-6-hydroxymethyldihydropteridine diphosphokinase
MSQSERVFLGLGSNEGDRQALLEAAIESLEALADTSVVKVSKVIETEPWGETDQPNFLNAVAEIRTGLEPEDLLAALKGIETDLGRKVSYRWGPRAIDIDIILYGRREVDLPHLTIPHRHARERDFVLTPLREIAPEVADALIAGTWTSQQAYGGR